MYLTCLGHGAPHLVERRDDRNVEGKHRDHGRAPAGREPPGVGRWSLVKPIQRPRAAQALQNTFEAVAHRGGMARCPLQCIFFSNAMVGVPTGEHCRPEPNGRAPCLRIRPANDRSANVAHALRDAQGQDCAYLHVTSASTSSNAPLHSRVDLSSQAMERWEGLGDVQSSAQVARPVIDGHQEGHAVKELVIYSRNSENKTKLEDIQDGIGDMDVLLLQEVGASFH